MTWRLCRKYARPAGVTMKTAFAFLFLLLSVGTPTNPVFGASYSVPNSEEQGSVDLDAIVERTDVGEVSHFKVTLTVPPVSSTLHSYTQLFLWGWIKPKDGDILFVTSCVPSKGCPTAFPPVTGTFNPGDRVSVEADLPTSFVNSKGASLQAGIGNTSEGYLPSPNLLQP